MTKNSKPPFWEKNFKLVVIIFLLISFFLIFSGIYLLEHNIRNICFCSNIFYSTEASAEILESEKIWISSPKARYGFSLDEVLLLTQLLDGDYRISGDGEFSISRTNPNYKEIYKVLCVVMNRVRSTKFPNTVTEVVLARNQFHVFPKNLRTIPHWSAFLIVLDWCIRYDLYDISIQVIPEDHLYFYGDGIRNHTRRRF